ncbi:hypothetical protein N7474_003130 [Penicillium riverlandense]|uniref:uncharacterized protein n=1 Tax=Penicillium riverlandense TaxID=1903569 RepID=UPI002547C97F|nr:uncharacterized protein N7474_003130 [Penicillium riverlandense]KAJ5825992.1 hypothetical protein N7474_003130 [Penicillium riverlandense]
MEIAALQCIICPTQPNFSDKSHLLTHAASKAHLSHYFKLQVRSQNEPEAVKTLNRYDEWFKDNSLAKLLSDRMTFKEARKRKSLGKETPSGEARSTKKQFPRATKLVATPPKTAPLPDFLDPRLVAPCKEEPGTEQSIFVPSIDASVPDATPKTDPARYPTRSKASKPNPLIQDDGSESADKITPAVPVTPKRPRSKKMAKRLLLTKEDSHDSFVDHPEPVGDIDSDKERADEMTRLKGILWPGMDLFDSATKQMRRMRNQKKGEDVLKLMEMKSLCVEPTELVFSPKGTLQKEREITGNLEDYSPLKGESPNPMTKPRFARSKRRVLRQTDLNVKLRDRKGARKAALRDSSSDPEESAEESAESPSLIRRHKGLDSPFGYDGELGLTMRAFENRPHKGFTIFNDVGNPYKKNIKDPCPEPNVHLGTLTPTRLILGHKPDMPGRHGSAVDRASVGKENIEPILNSQGRVDTCRWPSPFAKGRDPNGYASGYLDEHDKYGYRPNPLLAPTSKLAMVENSAYGRNDSTCSDDWSAIARAVSPDGTISGNEVEFDQLYLDGSAN